MKNEVWLGVGLVFLLFVLIWGLRSRRGFMEHFEGPTTSAYCECCSALEKSQAATQAQVDAMEKKIGDAEQTTSDAVAQAQSTAAALA